MTASSRDLSKEKVRKLLERYHPREAFKILAASTLSSDQTVRGNPPAYVENEPHRITIPNSALQQFRSWDTELVRVAADEKEARTLVQKWREGGRVKTEDLVGIMLYEKHRQRKETR